MPDTLPPVVVLCGGLGTRLRAVVSDRPKALAPVGGVPFLDVLLGSLAAQGAHDVILAAGFLGDQLRAYAQEQAEAADGLSVRVIEEPEPLGTGGALRYAIAEARIESPFLALNGDTLFTGALAPLAQAHAASGATATVALVPPPGGTRFGRVSVSDDGQVTSFDEKDGRADGWTNAGVYALHPQALHSARLGEASSLERDIFPAPRRAGLERVRVRGR